MLLVESSYTCHSVDETSVVSPIYVLEVETATRATFNGRKTLVNLKERVGLIDASSQLLEPVITFGSVGFLSAMDPTAL